MTLRRSARTIPRERSKMSAYIYIYMYKYIYVYIHIYTYTHIRRLGNPLCNRVFYQDEEIFPKASHDRESYFAYRERSRRAKVRVINARCENPCSTENKSSVLRFSRPTGIAKHNVFVCHENIQVLITTHC